MLQDNLSLPIIISSFAPVSLLLNVFNSTSVRQSTGLAEIFFLAHVSFCICCTAVELKQGLLCEQLHQQAASD